MNTIDPSSNYANLLQEIATDSAKQIKQSALITQISAKMMMATGVAQELTMGAFGYDGASFDSSTPENSTFSLHI